MKRVKRAANDCEVLREARKKKQRTTAAASHPDPITESGYNKPSTPITRSFDTPTPGRLLYHDASTNTKCSFLLTPTHGSPDPLSNTSDLNASQAPALDEIEAQEEVTSHSAFHSTSLVSSTIDSVEDDELSPLLEFCALHIARFASQRNCHRHNLPPCISASYSCPPGTRYFASLRLVSYHKTCAGHAR